MGLYVLDNWNRMRYSMVMGIKTLKLTLILALFLSLIGSTYAHGNLVLNPGFETGWTSPDHWSKTGNWLFPDFGHTGIHCIGLQDSGSWVSTPMIVNPGALYHFSFYALPNVTSGLFFIHLRPWLYPNGTGWIGQFSYQITGDPGNWTFVSNIVEMPSNATSATIEITNEGVASGFIFLDDFYFAETVQEPGEWQQFFFEILYGSGSWIGLLLIVALFVIITASHKYSAVIVMPISVFVMVNYLQQDLGWHGIVIFIVGILLFLSRGKELKK